MSAPGGYFLNLTIDDGRSAERTEYQFALYGRAMVDLSEPFMLIGQDLLEDNWNNFAENGQLYAGAAAGNPGGAEWAPLAPLTIAQRVRQGYGEGPTLVRTGELRDSLTRRGAAGNVFDVQPMALTVGSSHWKAAIHHYGTDRIPARPLVGLTLARRTAIVARIGDYLQAQASEQITG